jgi:hypothetical protein
VWPYLDPFAENDRGPDHGEGADRDVVREPSALLDQRRRVNGRQRSALLVEA